MVSTLVTSLLNISQRNACSHPSRFMVDVFRISE